MYSNYNRWFFSTTSHVDYDLSTIYRVVSVMKPYLLGYVGVPLYIVMTLDLLQTTLCIRGPLVYINLKTYQWHLLYNAFITYIVVKQVYTFDFARINVLEVKATCNV